VTGSISEGLKAELVATDSRCQKKVIVDSSGKGRSGSDLENIKISTVVDDTLAFDLIFPPGNAVEYVYVSFSSLYH